MRMKQLMGAGLLLVGTLILTSAAAADCDLVGSVPAGVVVYHGAPVGVFTWRNPGLNPAPPFDHPANPDGPAWFAVSWQFSIHAGMRFLVGQEDQRLYLHQYQLSQMIATLTCDTHADFTAQTGINFDQGDYPAAQEFCRDVAPFQYNGYIIRQDQVRGEPELILCDPSAVLRYRGQKEWYVSQVPHDRTGGLGPNFDDEVYGCFLNNQDLSDFVCQAAEHPRQQLLDEAGRLPATN